MLLVAEHDVLFYRLTGEIQSWLKKLHHYPDYQLALLSKPDAEQTQRLQKDRYPYRLLNNIRDLKPLLDFSGAKYGQQVSEALPSFQEDWFANSQPDQTGPVLDWIEQSCGPGGVRLLTAMAMYPKLHGDLTYALYQHFAGAKSPKPMLAPVDLLKTVTLPWCRQGWLPQWLRQTLLKAMPKEDYQHARKFYLNLFDKKQAQSGRELALDIQKPPPFWRGLWLRYRIKRADYNSPMRDLIFTRILLMPYNPLGQLALRRRLINALPKAALSQWGAGLLLTLLTGVMLAAVYGLWQWQGVERYGQKLLQEKRQRNGLTVVAIHYNPVAEPLLQALGKGLSALGYGVAYKMDESIGNNRVVAPPELINDLGNAAAYLSWGADFAMFSESADARIELAAMPQTGQVFRDIKPETPFLTATYPENIPWQKAVDIKTVPDLTIDLSVKPIQPKMVNIPAGRFNMGSPASEADRSDDEGPQHEVRVSAFQLADSEVTFDEWDVCVKAKACPVADDSGWGRGQRPVINVSWNAAQTYIKWLNQALGLTGAKAYRLPSEAEWEYAARAGTTTAFFWGKQSSCLYANGYDAGQACKDGFDNTAPVRSFKPNAWGLYDMSGNVWEWVEDCWHGNYNNAPADGSAWLATDKGDCTLRSVRGGSWSNDAPILRSAYRYRITAGAASVQRPGFPARQDQLSYFLFSFSLLLSEAKTS